jgi:hypothetical protein
LESSTLFPQEAATGRYVHKEALSQKNQDYN